MPDKNKAKPKYKSIPKFNHNNASAIYNIARKLGANDTLARAILGVTHVEILLANMLKVMFGIIRIMLLKELFLLVLILEVSFIMI